MDTTLPPQHTEHSVADWRYRAACWGEDPELFYLTGKEDAATAPPQIAEAKAVCHRCPVQPECLAWALSVNDEYGILGGMSAEERKPLRRKVARESPPERNQPAGKTKRCELCRHVKSVGEFTSHAGRKDGLAARCKECHAHVRRQQRLQGPGQHRPRCKAAV